MTFRTRILLACLAAALVPLVLLAAGARSAVRERLSGQYRERVMQSRELVRAGLVAAAATVDARLRTLERRVTDEPLLRASLLDPARRAALIDFAPDAMRAAGLDFLLLVDERGTVLSSGHFRNDYDRDAAALADLLRTAGAPVLVAARTPAGSMLALVRTRTIALGERSFTIAGGTAIDSTFVVRLAGNGSDALTITLAAGGTAISSGAGQESDVVQERIPIAFIDATETVAVRSDGTLTVAHSLRPLHAVTRSMDVWFGAALAAAVLFAFVMAHVLAARVTRPVEELARRAARVELARYDVPLATRRRDEIGSLSRLLDRMVQRLRAGAQQLRDAERRATVGDMARQVNHDVRNGLLPIRNVISHLGAVARESPAALAEVFTEREGTLQAGIGYLENLATNYARLTPRVERQPIDVNALVRTMLHESAMAGDPRLTAELMQPLPLVCGDAVALRRVIENLAVNALESLHDTTGTARIRTAGDANTVVITVTDTGVGMTPDTVEHVFDDFYTTKERGTGLGLSIVRRLVTDMGGRIGVDSEPGRGTIFTVELPALS